MPLYLNTIGRSTHGIGICGRCSRKFPLDDLQDDPNFPGLKVCKDDLDEYDPYYYGQAPDDRINLAFVRPDTGLETSPSGLITEDGDSFIITEDGEGYIVV